MDMKQTEIILAALKFKISYLEDKGCVSFSETIEKNWTLEFKSQAIRNHYEKRQLEQIIKEIIKMENGIHNMDWHLSKDKRTIRDEQNQPVTGLVVSRMTPQTLKLILTAPKQEKTLQQMANFLRKNRFELEDYAFEIGRLLKMIDNKK